MKTKKIAWLTALITITVMLFAACGGNAIIGQWQLDKVVMNEEEYDAEEFLSMSGEDEGKSNTSLVLDCKDDGKVSIKTTILGETEKASGTWEKGDDGFVITIEGDEANVKVQGDEMKMSMPEEQAGGMEVALIFEKK